MYLKQNPLNCQNILSVHILIFFNWIEFTGGSGGTALTHCDIVRYYVLTSIWAMEDMKNTLRCPCPREQVPSSRNVATSASPRLMLLVREGSTQWDKKKNIFPFFHILYFKNGKFVIYHWKIWSISYTAIYYKTNVFYMKKINLNKKCELSHYVPHTVHSETEFFFPINNIIFRIIIYLFNQNKSKRCHLHYKTKIRKY